MRAKTVVVALVVWGLACSTGRAEEGGPFRDFLRAMVLKDDAAMKAIVLENREEMAVTFFVALKQSAGALRDAALDENDVSKIRGLLLVSARIARVFDEAYPGQNVLLQQFKDSASLLTGNVRMKTSSDLSMAAFLESSAAQIAAVSNRSTVAADLESIVAAATESPEDRVLRMLKEEQERLRREDEERARRERLADAAARLNRLLEARDERGLLNMLRDTALDDSMKGRIVAALGNLRSRQAVDELSRLLTTKAIQGTVVEALGKIGDDKAVDVLAARVADAAIQGRIVETLGKIRSDRAVNALVEILGDDVVGPRAAALLIQIWGEQAPARFIQVIRNPSQDAARRRQAIRAFASLHAPDEFAGLSSWASDPELKSTVAEVLPDTGDPRAVAALVAMLDDEAVASVAMTGLHRIGLPAGPALVARLHLFSPPGGAKHAAQVLQTMKYQPRTVEEKARLALAQGSVLATVATGMAGFSTAIAAMQAEDRFLRWTGAQVMAIDVGLPTVLLVGTILYLRRKWLWPSMKVRLGPGECCQYRKAVKKGPGDGHAEPGAITQTLWAQSRFGRRQRIKVETLATGESWEIVGEDGRSFKDTAPLAQNPKERNDVLVSVGRSVRPGTYLARGANVTIRVRVRAKPA
jgi:HEAT repeat protein